MTRFPVTEIIFGFAKDVFPHFIDRSVASLPPSNYLWSVGFAHLTFICITGSFASLELYLVASEASPPTLIFICQRIFIASEGEEASPPHIPSLNFICRLGKAFGLSFASFVMVVHKGPLGFAQLTFAHSYREVFIRLGFAQPNKYSLVKLNLSGKAGRPFPHFTMSRLRPVLGLRPSTVLGARSCGLRPQSEQSYWFLLGFASQTLKQVGLYLGFAQLQSSGVVRLVASLPTSFAVGRIIICLGDFPRMGFAHSRSMLSSTNNYAHFGFVSIFYSD